MADFSTLIATLQATIKTNYNQEITGQILQDDLLAIVDAVNRLKQDTLAGYAFYGAPLANGASVAVTQNTFFLVGKGTYTINGTTETTGEGISALVYDSVNDEVRNYSLFVYDTTPTQNSKNAITSGAVAAALAPLATKEEVEAVEQEVAQVAGEAGLAEAVIDTDGAGTEQEFTFRKSGGDGGAYYRKIKGKSVVVNQIANQSRFENTVTRGNVTFTNNGDGTITVNGTPDNYAPAYMFLDVSFGDVLNTKKGHKIYLRGSIGNVVVSSWNDQDGEHTGIFTVPPADMSAANLVITFNALATANNVKIIPEVIDLTLWFGAGNEPSTAAEFEALYPDPLPYTPGTLISNDAEAVETTGVNQWDEEWEVGGLDGNGAPTPNNIQFRSKNYIPTFGSTTYYIKSNTGTGIQIFQYDANHRYLDRDFVNNAIITTFENTRYLKFRTPDNNTTYNHDICINLSDPAINGQYFPYWKRTLHLGLTTRKDTDGNVPFADGMKGAGTAADWCDKVGGEKRMKRVDLGNVNWAYNATYQFFIGTTILDNPIGVAGVAPNMICPKYETYKTRYDSQVAGDPDKIISGYSAANGVIIHDTDHSAADLVDGHAAWLEGVMLDYELATPVPFTWKEPLNLGVKVDENGTERAVAPEGATAPSAPFVADTTYTMSVARMVEILQNL